MRYDATRRPYRIRSMESRRVGQAYRIWILRDRYATQDRDVRREVNGLAKGYGSPDTVYHVYWRVHRIGDPLVISNRGFRVSRSIARTLSCRAEIRLY